MDPGLVCWQEQLVPCGVLDLEREVGDVVLRRADGFLAYHLATAVDELSLGIADVVRGADLWAATGPQVAVMRHLRPHGSSLPRYWHTPLWRDGAGERLSKRQGGTDLADLRARGLDAAAVLGLLAASLDLVPAATRLSSTVLLQEQSLPRLQTLLRQTMVAQDAAGT